MLVRQPDESVDIVLTMSRFTSRNEALDSANREEHRKTRELIALEKTPGEMDMRFEGVRAGIEMLSVSPNEECELLSRVADSILERLRFPAMGSRYEIVDEAHTATFKWIFKKPTQEQQRW